MRLTGGKKSQDRMRPQLGQKYSITSRSPTKRDSHKVQAAARRSRKQARRRLAFRLEAVVVVSLFLIVGFQSLRLSTNPVVNMSQSNFSDESAAIIEARIRGVAKEVLGSSLKNQIKPYIPRDKLIKEIESLPEVESVGVSVNRSAPRPILSVKLRNIDMLYRAAGTSYLLTSGGQAISTTERTIKDGGEALPLLNDVVSRAIPEGDQSPILAPKSVRQILSLESLLGDEGQGIVVTSFEINQNPGELLVRLESRQFYLKLLLGETFEEQGAAVVSFLEAVSTGEIDTPLEYIDARLVSRIVYR